MVESNLEFDPSEKPRIEKLIMEDRKLPVFGEPVSRVSYEDGCKVFFANGDFIICRFSGTEPLLRIFAESHDEETANGYVKVFKDFVFEK